MPQPVVQVVENVELFVVDERELFAKQHEVVGERVGVAVQSQVDQVARVALIHVRQDVHQQPVDLFHRRLKRAQKRVTCTRQKTRTFTHRVSKNATRN